MLSKVSKIVFLLITTPILIFSQGDYKLLESNSNYAVISYSPEFTDTSVVRIDNEQYKLPLARNTFVENIHQWGMPSRMVRVFSFGVPSETGTTIQILSSNFSGMEGKLLPVAKPVKDDKFSGADYSLSPDYSTFKDKEVVTFGEFGRMRDVKVQDVKVYPIRFNYEEAKISLLQNVVFRVNFGTPEGEREEVKHRLLDQLVVNPEIDSKWGEKVRLQKRTKINSVLADGTWYKFEAPEEGIYRIGYNKLSSIGIDPSSVDPRTIKIYNNGGMPLPTSTEAEHFPDLHQVAIKVIEGEDGAFNEGDFILFYGRGIDYYKTTESSGIERNRNHFSDANYYWITSGGNAGKRIQSEQSLSSDPEYVRNTTRTFAHLEENKMNIGQSGQNYLGDEFSSSAKSHTYVSSLNELVPDEPVKYEFRFINASQPDIPLKVTENDKVIFSSHIDGYGTYDYSYGESLTGSYTFNGDIPENRSVLEFTFDATQPNARGYLDYFEIEYTSRLRAVQDQKILFADETAGIITEYNVTNFSTSNIKVFDVTNFDEVTEITNTDINAGEVTFRTNENSTEKGKYIAVHPNAYKEPVNFRKEENSNVHGMNDEGELIIITNKKFAEQAERLRDYRGNKSRDKLPTTIAYVDEIFNEFGGGLKDPTAIRNFIAYAYDVWSTKPGYILLFGDGTYDILNREGLNNNFVPTYQTEQSLDKLDAFPSDDYYGEIVGDDRKMDLAIGRLNVQTQTEAEIVINKIKTYETKHKNGLWRTKITLVADDGKTSEGNDYGLHIGQSEKLSKSYVPPFFNQNKIYLPQYKTVNTGLGRRKPEVNEAIVEAINNGTLILNFIGHGNPEVWTHEYVFEKATTIPKLKNDDLFFLTAATCDFGLYDDPTVQSGTELMLLRENSGIIGGFTAARGVYSGPNAALNEAFYARLFPDQSTGNLPPRIGDAYYLAKRTRNGTNDRKFHLFGDPTMRLNQPRLDASVDSVNSMDLSQEVQIKALSNVNIKGSVLDRNGSVNSTYTGEAIISVFDSQRRIELPEVNTSMTENGGVIYRGRASIDNGKFETGFTVSKDISYENNTGKIVAYFQNDETDGIGFTRNIEVGGVDTTAANDGEGPKIEVFFDDMNFENSYLVNPNFTLIVKLQDETGLNTTGSGIGHQLEGILDGDKNNPINFTDYFIGDLDAQGKSGKIEYKFADIEPGEHNLKIKAWDVFNNFSETVSYFSVVEEGGLEVRNVYNYPNPFKNDTHFTFQHNLTEPVNVKIKVYSIAGRLLEEIEKNNILQKFVKIYWDGRDKDGDLLANGTYLYKLNVETISGEYSKDVLGKLAIIR